MDESVTNSAITKKQAELSQLYDAFTRKYGLINDRANRLAFDRASSYYLLCSLEILDDDGKHPKYYHTNLQKNFNKTQI